MLTNVLLFGAILLAAHLYGGTLYAAYALRPVLRKLPSREGLNVHRLTTHRIERYMPQSGVGAGILAVAALIADHDFDLAWWLIAAGFASQVPVAFEAFLVNLPINRVWDTYSLDAIPEDEYQRLSARWDRFNAARLFGAFLAIGFYTAAALAL
jgi:hypothetical protein